MFAFAPPPLLPPPLLPPPLAGAPLAARVSPLAVPPLAVPPLADQLQLIDRVSPPPPSGGVPFIALNQ